MNLEVDVLRALLRLARRRNPPTLEQLVVRVGGEDAAVRTALASLARSGLVQRSAAGVRLSLPGLAVAVACAQRPRTVPAAAASSTVVTKPAERAERRTKRAA